MALQDFFKIFVFIAIFGCEIVIARKIPSYITLCHRNDPKINECMLRAIEDIRPHLKDGIPEMGLPSINPLVIPKAGLGGNDVFDASFKDLELYYADEFIIDNFDLNLQKLTLNISITLPRLRIISKYEIDGKILFLQLKGSGPADGNFTNVHSHAYGYGTSYTKKGKEYLKIGEFEITGEYGKPSLRFEQLFANNPEVTEQTNKILNDNIEEVIVELAPLVNKVVAEVLQSYISRLFERFSFDELFPK